MTVKLDQNRLIDMVWVICDDHAPLTTTRLGHLIMRDWGEFTTGTLQAIYRDLQLLAKAGTFPFASRSELPTIRFGRKMRPWVWRKPTPEEINSPTPNVDTAEALKAEIEVLQKRLADMQK
jgi:hypothetical protein